MIICPKCECANANTATLCKECGQPLGKADIRAYLERVKRENALRQKKDRTRERLKGIGAGGAALLALAVAAAGFVMRGGEFFFMFLSCCALLGAGFIGLFFPDALFKFRHMFDVRNIDAVEPSDFYYFTNALGSVLAIAAAIAFMAWAAFLPAGRGPEGYVSPGIYVEGNSSWEGGAMAEFEGDEGR